MLVFLFNRNDSIMKICCVTGSYHYDSGDTYKGDASLAIKKGEQEGKIVVSGEIYKTIFGGSLKISGQNLAGNGQGSFDLDAVHKVSRLL